MRRLRLGLRLMLLVAVFGCGGAQRPASSPQAMDEVREAAIARLLEITSRGDVAATRAMLAETVGFGGMWFDDTTCRRQLSTAGTIQGAGLDVLARCLATLRLAKSERSSAYSDLGVLTYEPGIEIEVLFGPERSRPEVRWIGYVSRRTREDALPTITQRALESHRSEGSLAFDETTRKKIEDELAANRAQAGTAWLKVCIDAQGAVTGAHGRQTTSLGFQTALVAAIKQWKFQPVVLGGQPTPVCSLVWQDYPAGAGSQLPRKLPLPVPPGAEAAVIVPTAMLKRLVGSSLLVPDDRTRTWLSQQRFERTTGTFYFCLTPQGTVDSVMTLRSTEVPGFDDQIRATVKGWRYAPVVVDGQPVPVCTHFVMSYSQR
jgi:TonB family protein